MVAIAYITHDVGHSLSMVGELGSNKGYKGIDIGIERLFLESIVLDMKKVLTICRRKGKVNRVKYTAWNDVKNPMVMSVARPHSLGHIIDSSSRGRIFSYVSFS